MTDSTKDMSAHLLQEGGNGEFAEMFRLAKNGQVDKARQIWERRVSAEFPYMDSRMMEVVEAVAYEAVYTAYITHEQNFYRHIGMATHWREPTGLDDEEFLELVKRHLPLKLRASEGNLTATSPPPPTLELEQAYDRFVREAKGLADKKKEQER